MRVKPAFGLLGATALWTATMLATAPVEAAPAAPQPVLPVAYVSPGAQLDPSNIDDRRSLGSALGWAEYRIVGAPLHATAYADYCFDAALAEGEYIDKATDDAAGKACAARFILARMDEAETDPTKRIHPDWTWLGMSPVVAEFHARMITEWQSTDADAETYLAYTAAGVFPTEWA